MAGEVWYTADMAGAWALTLKNLVIPIFCRECGRRLLTEENPCFCPTCWERSPRIERPFCSVCGEPQAGRAGFGALQNFPCEKCRSGPPRAFRRIYAAAVYDGAIGEAIRQLKFYEKRTLLPVLGELVRDFVEREMDAEQYEALIPVPLYPVRRRERGFNQSELLADELAESFPNAQTERVLRRVRPTAVQSRLKSPEARQANVLGAFSAPEPERIAGRTVLLIDDVVTSGSTVEECCRVLLAAGARVVDVLCVAIPVRAADTEGV